MVQQAKYLTRLFSKTNKNIQIPEGACKEDRARLFSVIPSDRKDAMGIH